MIISVSWGATQSPLNIGFWNYSWYYVIEKYEVFYVMFYKHGDFAGILFSFIWQQQLMNHRSYACEILYGDRLQTYLQIM